MDMSVPAIHTFIEELIHAKFGDRPLEPTAIAEITKELTERLNQYLTLRTIEMISIANPEAVTELSKLIKTNPSPDQVGAFINTHIKEPDVLVGQILADFRNLYLGVEAPKAN